MKNFIVGASVATVLWVLIGWSYLHHHKFTERDFRGHTWHCCFIETDDATNGWRHDLAEEFWSATNLPPRSFGAPFYDADGYPVFISPDTNGIFFAFYAP